MVQQDAMYQGDMDKDIVALVRGDKISDQDWETLWELPVRHLDYMSELLRSKNIPFLVVIIPDGAQVSDREWPNKKALGYPEHFVDPRGPYGAELQKRLKGHNILFSGLLEYFIKSNIFPLYFTYDGHFRESGHELAAQIIFERIKALNPEKLFDF